MKDKLMWERRRKRVFGIIEIGNLEDGISRFYDLLNALAIVVNLAASIMYTFAGMRAQYGSALLAAESVTAVFFCVDYLLRVWTARYLYPRLSPRQATGKYILSFTGLVDLLSWLPYYLPFFFPSGTVAFRMFRLVRIFRLFRINAYYDSLNVIGQVVSSKRQQLMSSVFIILTLMTASSLCMYSLEHEAQPEVFTNAFSGIWWAVSTLLTVGYGDIYPITDMGKFFSIIITFLGVGMVAIPTGIISAGFVDQYSRIKRISEFADEEDIRFTRLRLTESDCWVGSSLSRLQLPSGLTALAIHRHGRLLIPCEEEVLRPGDILLLGAHSLRDGLQVDLKELVLRRQSPWNGHPIRELDLSRQSYIIAVERAGRTISPTGDLVLLEGDRLILYSQTHSHPASL